MPFLEGNLAIAAGVIAFAALMASAAILIHTITLIAHEVRDNEATKMEEDT